MIAKNLYFFEFLNIINHFNEMEAGHAGRVLLQNEIIFILKLKDCVREILVVKVLLNSGFENTYHQKQTTIYIISR
ncbi:hypothetical protein EO18_25970 [Salmonella enterica]|nr:hypothetical protein [Salmonella enterica]